MNSTVSYNPYYDAARASMYGAITGFTFQAHDEIKGLKGRGDCPDLSAIGRLTFSTVVGAFYGTGCCLPLVNATDRFSACWLSNDPLCTSSDYWEIAGLTSLTLLFIASAMTARCG